MNLNDKVTTACKIFTTITFIMLIFMIVGCEKVEIPCGTIAQAYWSHEYGEVYDRNNASGELLPAEPYVVIQFVGESNSRHPLLNGVYEYDITKYKVGDFYCLE